MEAVSRVWNTSRTEIVLGVVAAFACAATVMMIPFSEKIDAFYMVASGNYMLDTGHIQTIVPEAPFELSIVVQNWLACIVYALAYRLGTVIGIGWFGVSAVHLLSVIFLLWSVWHISHALSKDNGRLVAFASIVIVCCMYKYVPAHRVHAFTYAVQLWVMYLSHRFCVSKETDWRALVCVLFAYGIYVCIQSALMPILCFLCGCVTLAEPKDVVSRKRRAAWILWNGIAFLLAVVLNPYGLDAVTYAFSMDDVDFGKFGVTELFPFYRWSFELIVVSMPAIFLTVTMFVIDRRHRFLSLVERLSLVVFFACMLWSFRLSSICYMYLVFVTCLHFDELFTVASDFVGKVSVDAILYGLALCCDFIFALFLSVAVLLDVGMLAKCCVVEYVGMALGVTTFDFDLVSPETPGAYARDEMEDGAYVFSDMNMGSRLAMLGYKVAVTSRWESWAAPNPWSDNWANDYYATLSDTDNEFSFHGAMAHVNWDYILVYTDSKLNTSVKAAIDAHQIAYEKVLETEDLTLYRQVSQ